MSKEQQYVRILPSAVKSVHSWAGFEGIVLKIMGAHDDVLFLNFANQDSPIERIHTEPVYVSTEPPVPEPDRMAELEARVKALEEQHEVTHRLAAKAVLCEGSASEESIGYLDRRISAIEEQQEYEQKRLDSFITGEVDECFRQAIKDVIHTNASESLKSTFNKSLEDAARPTETNLEKAKRLYPKGTRFKSMGMVTRDDIYVSSGFFAIAHDGCIFMLEMINDKPIMRLVYNGLDWATIMPNKPEAWILKIDIPEWGVKKGQESHSESSGMVKFEWQDYTASIPLSIMPHIAEAVVG